MKRFLLVLFALALMVAAPSARAQLLYSFEDGLDGFGPNGGGTTDTLTTVGATDGTQALNISVVGGASFVGALTGTTPAPLADPNTTSVKFDVTVPQAFGGAFADIGVTIFGALGSGASETFGNQFQLDTVSNIGTAGGPTTVTIPLVGTNPSTFTLHDTYANVLADGFIPTGFEFFISKSNDAPVSIDVDNVQAVSPSANTVPEPTSLGMLGVGGLLLMRRRRAA